MTTNRFLTIASGVRRLVTAIASSSGATDASKIVATGSDGRIHPSLIGIVGEVKLFAMATLPTGWLACDGSAVSRTTYPTLFAAIGTTWGAGNGSSTFNLPDLRGRTPVGSGQGTSLTNRTLGGTGGAETHVLTVGEMPSHSHALSDSGAILSSQAGASGGPGAFGNLASIANTGGGGAHNNMMPFAVVRVGIFAG